jgi:glycosyltransferase involved in cell wall biosynthesis
VKVLFYLQSLSSGGAERVTATLANYWARKGWAITVVTVAGEERDFYELEPQVTRIAMDMAIKSRHAGEALLHNLRRIRALRRILRREKPDVAIAMMASANATLALAGRLAGVTTIGSERIHPPELPLGRIWELVRRRTYPLLDGLVAQTRDSAAWLRQQAPPKTIRVIANPVDYPLKAHEPRIAPANVLESLSGKQALLAVGRFDEQKGFDRLLSSFAKVSGKHGDWSLVILGEGRLRAALTQQAADLGIADRVVLPGAVGNVGDWFEAAELYALTSRFEGFPNTLVEALGHGLPAVAVDCKTGPREIVRHEVDGLLVPQDDPDALAAALDRMMYDVALRERFSLRAVEARERFAVERIAEQWESLFRQVTRTSARSEDQANRDQLL